MGENDAVDKWADWLIDRRDGDDAEQRQMDLEFLLPLRQRVLDNAQIVPGEIVLDVGAGDGLIAFGALDRVGEEGCVIVSDVSEDLLSHTRSLATELGVEGRMSFVRAAAEELSAIANASVDVVTTRSVLIYVNDKAAAFRAFHRVLKPGGRLSIFEPINNYFPLSQDEFWGFDGGAVRDLVAKVRENEGWVESSFASDPMMNFTEKDLVRCAEGAGFREVHVELLVDVEPGTWVVDWERDAEHVTQPQRAHDRRSIRAALTDEELARFEKHLRPLADAGQGTLRLACAYLRAVKT